MCTTARVYLNDEWVLAVSNGDGKETWSVGTLVVHAGDQAGGYAVVGGRLDLAGQGGMKGFSPLAAPWTDLEMTGLAGPCGGNPVYLAVGEAAQFTASGVIRQALMGADQPVGVIERFASSDPSVGEIGDADRAMADVGKTFRFWVNDDDDSGDIAEGDSDVPGQSGSNCSDAVVNGRCDLLDFFPVWLDLKGALDAFPTQSGVTFRLRSSGLRFVYTALKKSEAGKYLRGECAVCGPAFNQDAREAPTFAPAEGSGNQVVELTEAFLSLIKADGDKGVLLVECSSTLASLELEIVDPYGDPIAFRRLHLVVSGVEDMYRWVNLRGIAGGTENRATDVTEPANFPDVSSNGREFIFVHGYNVSEAQARAWNAEMFKRLWQSGSRAMYTAVTWFGNDSQAWWWLNNTPNYYANVEHAFASASALANAVNNSLPGVKVVAGHSLGNMLVSCAIADHGLGADAYFMLNAAVAMEAYDSAVSHASVMRHPDWQGYDNKLWASEWHRVFTNNTADARGTLTWRNRFGSIPNAVNYYSSTEDVLASSDGTLHAFLASEWSWVNQEMRKGLWPLVVPGNNEAGWDFNRAHDVTVGYDPNTGAPIFGRMPPATASLLPDSVLQTNSFFRLFDDETLYGANGSAVAAQPAVRAQLLADAIPALSNPAGSNPITSWDTNPAVQRNHDMHGMRDTGATATDYIWPQSRVQSDDGRDWLHSDIKNIAFRYVYKVFEQIRDEGGLK